MRDGTPSPPTGLQIGAGTGSVRRSTPVRGNDTSRGTVPERKPSRELWTGNGPTPPVPSPVRRTGHERGRNGTKRSPRETGDLLSPEENV